MTRSRSAGEAGETDALLAVTFVAVVTVPLLAVLRSWDDNTLTSWNWVFSFVDPLRVYLLVLAGTGLSFLLSRSELLERSPLVPLPVLALLAVLPLWQEPEMILDASRYFLQAKHLELSGIGSFLREWGFSIAAWTDLPLVPFLQGLIFRFFGEARIYIQAFTSTLFSLTLVLTYLIGKRIYDRETGLFAALLLLGIPYLLVQVPLMLVDVPTMFFVTLAIHAFLEALESGGPARTAFASMAVFFAVFSKYSAGLMLLVLLVIVFVLHRKGREAVLRRSLQVLVPAVVLSLAALLAKYEVVSAQVSLLASYQLPGLGRWQEGLASSFLFQVHPLITVAALVGSVQALRKRELWFAVPAWFAVFVLFIQHERIRYFLPLFPLFTLMAARGIRELRGKVVRRYLVYCVVTASIAIGASAYVPFFRQTGMANLQEAGQFLNRLGDLDNLEVLALPQHTSAGNTEAALPLLDLYTARNIVYRRNTASRPDEKIIALSPLRFTWETPLPAFYQERKERACLPLAVISSSVRNDLGPGPPGASVPPLAEFRSSTGVFRYKSFVTLFGKSCLDETGQ
ncbi:MAG: hypothetical protein A2010_12635 [Nitrospirae bacterium GWD2_57_9]|nr:MAG: hypothetical protein A2010_12635 [Nitrospirae bacterium GWD2_57_9]